MSAGASSTFSDLPLDDPTALARFGKLEVVARLLVEGALTGKHKSPYKGASVEFAEHRQYYPGDEIRHIDWRAYGKTGRYYVKEYEEETNLRAYLLLDASGSMAYSGRTLSKFDYARYLAAALAYLLLTQRDAAGLLTFDTEIRERWEPSTSVRSFRQLTGLLETCKPGGETSLAKVIERLSPTIPRRSLVILLSDCFDRLSGLTEALMQIRHLRHELIVFHLVAPEEEEFPFNRPTQFCSLERSGHRVLADPLRLRSHYLKRYRQFCSKLAQRAAGMGIEYHKMVTSEPYHFALGAFLNSRMRDHRKR